LLKTETMNSVNAVGIINAGIGNIKSIERMLFKVGALPIVFNTPSELGGVEKVILPGVGHFDAGMKRLKESGFDNTLIDLIKSKQLSVLGVCLGMQLLCCQSEEGSLPGLGLVEAEVNKFSFEHSLDIKVPHMGWNIVKPLKVNPLLPKSLDTQRFYFVHSFKVNPADSEIVIGETDYGGTFCSAFQQDNIFGVQFHPEKSHRYGLSLIKRFVDL
jgi:glutamine amidotransferase